MKNYLRKTLSIILALTMICTPVFQTAVFASPSMSAVMDTASEAPVEENNTTNVDNNTDEPEEGLDGEAYDEWKKSTLETENEGNVGSLASLYGYIRNDYVEAYASSDGYYSIGTTGGDPNLTTDNNQRLMYGHPGGGTSDTLLSIDGSIYEYTASTTEFAEDGKSFTSINTYNGVKVVRTISLKYNSFTGREDVVEIQYTMINETESSMELGGRIMHDIMVGSNDSAPFRIPDVGNVTYEREFSGNSIPQHWQAFNSLTNPSVVAYGTFYRNASQKPDRVQFARWGNVNDGIWDYTVNSSSSFGDSAVVVYYNPVEVPAGGSRTFATWYGISDLSEAEEIGSITLRLAGDIERLYANEDETDYEDNPFTLIAYINNTYSNSEDVTLTLTLPPELEIANGAALVRNLNVPASSEINASWQIYAKPQYRDKTVEYSITIYADETEKTVTRELFLPRAAICEAHIPGEWTVTRDATCTSSGFKTAECSVCSEVVTAVIPSLGHNYVSRVTSVLTCTRDGEITYTCSNCGDSYKVVTTAEHKWQKTNHVEPTCTEDGKDVYTCSVCGDSYIEVLTAAHDYVPEVTRGNGVGVEGEIVYTCSVCGDSYSEILPALREGEGYVLLVQDRIPWSSNDNTAVLNKLVEDNYIKGYTHTTSDRLDELYLEEYDVILLANDQNTNTYDKLEAYIDALEEYANEGGVVIYGACDRGWANGFISYNLPGGVSKGNSYHYHNYIVDSAHPVVTGSLTDDKAITNTLLYGNYASHTYFNASTLPEGANVILEDGEARPTLVEYPLGDGKIIASGLTWEFFWYRPAYGGGTNDSYSRNVYDDLIVYAVSTTGIESCAHGYDEGVTVEPTCTTEGYTLHTCLVCKKQIKDNFVPAYGHEVSDWITEREATCTEDGSEYTMCEECEEILDRRATEATGHDLVTNVITQPTCTETGLAEITCNNCEYINAQIIDALGHDFDGYGECTRCGVAEYTVTVHFTYSDGSKAFDDVVLYVAENQSYSIEVEEIEGYMTNMTFVSGIAVEDVTYTVVYSPISAKQIIEISNIYIGDVDYNTPFSALALPETVAAYTESGEEVYLRVIWDSTDYDATVYGEQEISGTALALFGYEFVCDTTVLAALNICENEIVEIPVMDLGRLPLGISYEGLGLPSTAAVVTKSGATHYLPVEWDEYSYDSSREGSHTIYGDVSIEDGFVLGDGVEAVAMIKFELSETMYGTADIVFLIDTTGSMWDEIQNVKNNINLFAEHLESDGVSARWALLEYRDITCDGRNSTKIIYNGASEWYFDVNSYKRAIASLDVNGGGDREETVVDALKAATFLEEREDAVTFYIVVTDADFKENNSYGVSGMDEMIDELVENETVASCVTKTTYFDTYRPMTDATGGILANIDGNFANELLKLRELIADTILYGKVVSIEITEQPNKTHYYSGDRFDGTGMEVTAVYDSGYERVVTGYTVSPYGALSVDDTSVEISYRGVTAELSITVEEAEYPVTGVSVAPNSLDMRVGDLANLRATIRPVNATNKNVFFETSNPNVAIVSEDGVVEAVGEGDALITVITADGGYTATVEVMVENYIPVTDIYLSAGAVTLEIGDEYEYEVFIYPEDATDKRVEWTISDTSVAEFSGFGVITAVGEGGCILTATSLDTGVSASMYVSVLSDEPDYYIVSFDANGGEGAPEAKKKFIGSTVVIPDVIPELEGFEFDGWSTTRGGVPEYYPGDRYMEDADLTLYAVWVKKTNDDTSSYVLFNSGRTGYPDEYGGYTDNYDEASLTNGGYDLYAHYFYSRPVPIRLGISLKIDKVPTQDAILTILSYDVDENSGERDVIYLVDETDGTEVALSGYLHGMDEQWNSTTLYVPCEYLKKDHTYHFKLKETVDGWCVWVRNVTIQLTDVAHRDIIDSDFEASIDSTGVVHTVLNLTTTSTKNYTTEYAAVYNHIQYGSAFSEITSSPAGSEKEVDFELMSGSPEGEYTIVVTIKDEDGDIVLTLSDTAEYVNAFTVTYDANGGEGAPEAQTKYVGEAIEISDVIPEYEGFEFLGWATCRGGVVIYLPGDEYAEDEDITLYAVWGRTTIENVAVYELFNSGRTSSPYEYTVGNRNYDDASYSNGGYDLFARAYDTYITPIRLGLSITVDKVPTQDAILTILSYDVDENRGERDIIYLVDETDGTEVALPGYLHGMNQQWNSTTIYIPAEYFVQGHTYHFKLDETVDGWHIWVRNVTLQLTDVEIADIVEANLDASINADGQVLTSMRIVTETEKTYSLEYAAVHDYIQYGSAFSTVTSTPAGVIKNLTFDLEEGAPMGEYIITLTIKDEDGNIVLTVRDEAEYRNYEVIYDANGGMGQVPEDTNEYAAEESVNVKFSPIPTREDFVFLGWSTDEEAETAQFTQHGIASFKITENTTLYAVWKFVEEDVPVIAVDTVRAMPDSTVEVDVVIKNNPGVSGIKLELEYSDRLILTSVEKGSALASLEYVPSEDYGVKPYVMLYYSATNDSSNGVLVTLIFKVPETTPEGMYNVAVTSVESYNSAIETVEFETIVGGVAVSEALTGDVNSDGRINIQDVILMAQYCAGWETIIAIVNPDAADTNGDGRVNIQDVILLAQYCAGWSVTLGGAGNADEDVEAEASPLFPD